MALRFGKLLILPLLTEAGNATTGKRQHARSANRARHEVHQGRSQACRHRLRKQKDRLCRSSRSSKDLQHSNGRSKDVVGCKWSSDASRRPSDIWAIYIDEELLPIAHELENLPVVKPSRSGKPADPLAKSASVEDGASSKVYNISATNSRLRHLTTKTGGQEHNGGSR